MSQYNLNQARKSQLIPHELRPVNTAQSSIEANRLTNELNKLERDKRTSILQLAASQAALQKDLRTMVKGGQQSAQGDDQPTAPSPSGSSLVSGAPGTTRSRLTAGHGSDLTLHAPSSRISVATVHAADPDLLASVSTKSFHGQIIGGQAQLQRKLSTVAGNMRSHSSLTSASAGSSAALQTGAKISAPLLIDGSLYNVPEKGELTGVEFTEEDVEKGVQETLPAAEQTGALEALAAPEEEAPALTVTMVRSDGVEAQDKPPDSSAEDKPAEPAPEGKPAEPETEDKSAEVAAEDKPVEAVGEKPERPPDEAPDATKTADDAAGTADAAPQARPSVVKQRDSTVRAVGSRPSRLGRTSRTKVGKSVSRLIAPTPPATISEQVYCRAVERAFAAKCLKHAKFVTDFEMNDFVLKFLLPEQQKENFRKADEFVEKIVGEEIRF